MNGTSGKCLFVWDCYKTEGTSLGLCHLDKSIYGSCCYHNESANVIPDPDQNTTPPTVLDIDYSDGDSNQSVAAETQDFGTTIVEPETTTLIVPIPSVQPDEVSQDKNNGSNNIVPAMQTPAGSPKCGISVQTPKNISSEFRIVGGENCKPR